MVMAGISIMVIHGGTTVMPKGHSVRNSVTSYGFIPHLCKKTYYQMTISPFTDYIQNKIITFKRLEMTRSLIISLTNSIIFKYQKL